MSASPHKWSREINRRIDTSRRSSALVMTMVLVSLVAILLVGFVASMRSEIFSARSHFNGVRASFFAQAGADAGAAKLAALLKNSYDTNMFWVSAPGRLLTTNSGIQNLTVADLSSGIPTSTASNVAVDLNAQSLQDRSSYLVFSTNQPMRVKWIYVRQNGAFDTNFTASPPTYSSSNPVVGRFAFWVDDESAKINLNTARARVASNAGRYSHPSRADLSMLSSLLSASDAEAIYDWRNNNHFYNSPRELGALSTSYSGIIAGTNNYNVTVYNHSPDVNMFNEPKIALTTRKGDLSLYGMTNFIDVLKDTGAGDVAYLSSLDTAKVETLVKRLYNILTRKIWPFYPSTIQQGFVEKYATTATPQRAVQIALNIIDYVRSVESPQTMVEPLRGKWDGTQFKWDTAALSGASPAYLGNSRRPVITEVGCYVTDTKNSTGAYEMRYYVKIYLPQQIGSGANIKLDELYFSLMHADRSGTDTAPFGGYELNHVKVSDYVVGPDASLDHLLMGPGETRTLRIPADMWGVLGTRPRRLGIRMYLENGGATAPYPALDIVPMTESGLTFDVDNPSVVAEADVKTCKVADPLVNKLPGDWSLPGVNGLMNSVTLTALGNPNANIKPQQDADNAGQLTAASTKHPAYNSGTGWPNGYVRSVGELGYIHTGIECTEYVGTTTSGVPFRTIRLQPQNSATMTTSTWAVPDWALIDFFGTPPLPVTAAEKNYVLPMMQTNRQNNVSQAPGGTINLNNRIASFTNGTITEPFPRYYTLAGMLNGARTNSIGVETVGTTRAGVLASNIVARTLANTTPATGRRWGVNGETNFFFAVGQVAEIQGIADGGESTEELMREILGLATPRGNVFTIYSIGQVIRQNPSNSNDIKVMSESRQQTTVERMTSPTKVTFRPVFSRELKP